MIESKKFPKPGEDAAEVVADGRENGVCGIAGEALEVAPAEATLLLHVADRASVPR